jgi:cysteinyl-tRNA synthetase
MIALTNTLTGKKEPFVSLKEMAVNLYVCGITPYDYAHIGHGRVYVTFDILLRMLRLSGYQVTYCRNFTDIDDKLLQRAHKELGDKFRYPEVAQKYIDAYHEDVAALGCYDPEVEPRVTETIPQIIAFIEGLIKNGYAYQVEGDVYYRIMKCASYGKLSKRKTEDLLVGARVELNEKKENPLDFALWKGEEEGTFWKSPWGYGRPGWHIECSAMAAEYLAPHIDIHGGGMDLIFPHHENEIAQSEGLYGGTFSTFWMHNAFVRINQEKMSKLAIFLRCVRCLRSLIRWWFVFIIYNTIIVRRLIFLLKIYNQQKKRIAAYAKRFQDRIALFKCLISMDLHHPCFKK